MQEGPFRMPRPASRDADSQDESRQTHEPKRVSEEVKKVQSSHRSLRNERSKKPFVIAGIIAAALLIAALGWTIWTSTGAGKSSAAGIDTSKYQAVFFTNGQVYFGKLSYMSDEYLKLNDIYYLEARATEAESNKKLQETTDNANLNNVTMVKLGSEIHGPQDSMVINRDQVLFYENLKDDGKVVKAISDYKNPKK